MTVDKGSMENMYDIRQRHVDIMSDNFERGNGTHHRYTDTVWTIIVVLMLCQLIVLLAALGYGLYEHNNMTSILVSNITTEYFNNTSLYPIKVLNGSHVWKNYTVLKN